jgi:hypothetical protein
MQLAIGDCQFVDIIVYSSFWWGAPPESLNLMGVGPGTKKCPIRQYGIQ